jgi:hypothetical protein
VSVRNKRTFTGENKMARKTKAEKALEARVNAAFKLHSSGIQVNIMDLGKILDAGRLAGREGGDVEGAIQEALQKYRKN